MANNQEIVGGLALSGWSQSCVGLLPNLTTITEGFVGEHGEPLLRWENSVWGISKPLCDQYCNEEAIPVVRAFSKWF